MRGERRRHTLACPGGQAGVWQPCERRCFLAELHTASATCEVFVRPNVCLLAAFLRLAAVRSWPNSAVQGASKTSERRGVAEAAALPPQVRPLPREQFRASLVELLPKVLFAGPLVLQSHRMREAQYLRPGDARRLFVNHLD
jgi:hypothetical protein